MLQPMHNLRAAAAWVLLTALLGLSCTDDAAEPGPAFEPPDAAPELRADAEPEAPPEDVPDTAEPPDPDPGPAEDADFEPDLGEPDAGPPEPPLEATGFYYVAQREGRWWLVTPEGKRFYSLGVNHITPNGYTDKETGETLYADAVDAKYSNDEVWGQATAERLDSWGFNTVGAWSTLGVLADKMAYTAILSMAGADWMTGTIPDYFDPEFETRCAEIAAKEAAPRAEDPLLVGYFLDNEMRWGPDHRSEKTLLQDYLELEEGAPGRVVAESFEGDASAFLSALSDRYFEVTTTAIRKADPNHLILGVRSISAITPPEVPAAAAAWIDVFSVNYYMYVPGTVELLEAAFGPVMSSADWLAAYHEATGLPLLISEFSFRALDSGLPNDWPPIYPTFDTQAERADAYEDYAQSCFDAPYVVGHHWFEHMDDPAGGRFDGENSNFGLVDHADEPYTVFVERTATVAKTAPGAAGEE